MATVQPHNTQVWLTPTHVSPWCWQPICLFPGCQRRRLCSHSGPHEGKKQPLDTLYTIKTSNTRDPLLWYSKELMLNYFRQLCNKNTPTKDEQWEELRYKEASKHSISVSEDQICPRFKQQHASLYLGGASELVVSASAARAWTRSRSGTRTGSGARAAVGAVFPLILQSTQRGDETKAKRVAWKRTKKLPRVATCQNSTKILWRAFGSPSSELDPS